MRKIFTLLLAVMLVFSCSACKTAEDVLSNESIPTEKIAESDVVSDTASLVSNDNNSSDIADTSTENTTTQSTATQTESEVTSSVESSVSQTSSVTSTNSRATVSLIDYVGEGVNDTVNETTNVMTDITTDVMPDFASDGDYDDTEITPMIAFEDLFYFGTIADNTYESSFLGIGCTLGSDWTLLTESEIKEANGIAADATDAEITEQIEYAIILFDMAATTSTGDASVMVMTISDYGYGEFEALDMDEYFNELVDSAKEIYTEAGYNDTVVERTTLTIGEQQYFGVNMSVTMEETSLYQTMFCIKDGPYFTCVQIVTSDAETLQQTLNSFYTVQ